MPGFDALGTLALGQVANQGAVTSVLVAGAGSYALAANATDGRDFLFATTGGYAITGNAAFGGSLLPAPAGSYALGGTPALFAGTIAAAADGFAIGGQTAAFKSTFAAPAGAYAISGGATAFQTSLPPLSGGYVLSGGSSWLPGTMRVDGGGYVVALGEYALRRSGGDYDQVYGGIGHYLEELERIRQLARITRKTPAPIVHETGPRLPPIAPSVAEPMMPQPDPRQIIARRLEAEKLQRQAAIAMRRRREAEILLLAC